MPLAPLKAHCSGADWRNKTIKEKRFRKGSVISMYSEIHKDDHDLISIIGGGGVFGVDGIAVFVYFDVG